MSSSRFFRVLPRELRDQITTLALTVGDGTITLHADKKGHGNHCADACVHSNINAWALTCKQAHQESGDLLITQNKFTVTCVDKLIGDDNHKVIAAFINTKLQPKMGLPRFAMIRTLHIDLGRWHADFICAADMTPVWDFIKGVKSAIHPQTKITAGIIFDCCDLSGNIDFLDIGVVLPVGDAKGIEDEINKVVLPLIELHCAVLAKKGRFRSSARVEVETDCWRCGKAVKRFTKELGE